MCTASALSISLSLMLPHLEVLPQHLEPSVSAHPHTDLHPSLCASTDAPFLPLPQRLLASARRSQDATLLICPHVHILVPDLLTAPMYKARVCIHTCKPSASLDSSETQRAPETIVALSPSLQKHLRVEAYDPEGEEKAMGSPW